MARVNEILLWCARYWCITKQWRAKICKNLRVAGGHFLPATVVRIEAFFTRHYCFLKIAVAGPSPLPPINVSPSISIFPVVDAAAGSGVGAVLCLGAPRVAVLLCSCRCGADWSSHVTRVVCLRVVLVVMPVEVASSLDLVRWWWWYVVCWHVLASMVVFVARSVGSRPRHPRSSTVGATWLRLALCWQRLVPFPVARVGGGAWGS